MNTQTQEALKMAIEAISYQDSLSPDDSSTDWNCSRNELKKALDACILALEQPAWQGLTDDEINEILVNHDLNNVEMAGNHIDVVLLMIHVEQALREKNHGL
jgi:hypothetical protein